MLEDFLEVFITALGEAAKNTFIGLAGNGANFIQTDHSRMQLLGNDGDVLALNLG